MCPLKHVPICTFKTSQCVPAPRAHVFQHMCALFRHARGRFEPTYGDVFEWTHGFFQRFTPHHNTAPHTPHTTPRHKTQHHTETGRDRQRQRQREKRGRKRRRQDKIREKREKIHFQCGGAWPFFIGVVIFRLIPFAHETLAS